MFGENNATQNKTCLLFFELFEGCLKIESSHKLDNYPTLFDKRTKLKVSKSINWLNFGLGFDDF